MDRLRYFDEPARKRVEEILSMLVAADAHLGEMLRRLYQKPEGAGPEFLDNFKKQKESERAYYQTLELLNIKLSRYRWEAMLSGDINGFRSEIAPAHLKSKWEYTGRGNGFDYKDRWQYLEYTETFLAQREQLLTDEKVLTREKAPKVASDLWESMFIARLLKIVNQGLISRFRQCLDCHQWFFAVRGHQKFCGNACRRRHEAQSPAFKEKRAKYMRERYRPHEKAESERAKQQVRWVPSKKSKKGGK